MAAFVGLVFEAAQDLLPPWAQRMHGLAPKPVTAPAVRAAARSLGVVLRWALQDGVEARARRRAAELGLRPAPPRPGNQSAKAKVVRGEHEGDPP
jgi:hypothetical protein